MSAHCACSASSTKDPDQISESELQQYFLHRKNRDRWSPNTMRICYCGIRFFFLHVLKRDWHTLDLVRAQSESRLPAVLSREEVRTILGCVRTPHNRAFLSTVYACGLRLQEALLLEVSDIDSRRMMIHVHRGKGAKDRFVPLPRATLEGLRTHWRAHRNPRLLFPAYGRDSRSAAAPARPWPRVRCRAPFAPPSSKPASQREVSVHTLRHSYATSQNLVAFAHPVAPIRHRNLGDRRRPVFASS